MVAGRTRELCCCYARRRRGKDKYLLEQVHAVLCHNAFGSWQVDFFSVARCTPPSPPSPFGQMCVCVCVDSGRDNYHNHLRRRRRRRRNSPRNGKIIYNPPYARNARAPSPPPRRCCVHVVYTLTFLYYYYYFEISGRPTRGPSPSSAHPFSPDGINAFSYGRVRIIIIRAYRFIFRIVIIIFISRNRRFYEPVKTKYASMFPSRVCAPTGITKGVGGYLLPRAPRDRQRQWRPTTAF